MTAPIPDKTVQEIVEEISKSHHEIINDWCKAYLAQRYLEDGKVPMPGDFILEQRQVKAPGFGYEYRFRRREEIDDSSNP